MRIHSEYLYEIYEFYSVFEILKVTWPVGPVLIEHRYH